MRFTSILLALPFVATAFSAPTPKAEESLVKKDTQVDVVAAVQAVVEVVSGCGSLIGVTDVTAVVEVFTKIHVALGQCGDLLNVNVGLAADLGISLKRDDIPSEVAGLLATVVKDVDGLIKQVDTSILPEVQDIIGQVDTALATVLFAVEVLLAGVLQLVKNLLGDLGLSGLLAGVTGLLGSLVGGLVPGLAGLLGGLLGGLGL
ncbi:hypothetical protein TREMEDRAFT_66224 [Tremella mesenterica DSM 1558]|uniref:uncharacterized protein n=1 Tax=Tremella mesenterica (strain ATCC 24925 / CBS 8224 / DSM 1558 / NBRC 9311 / NRRL Y-6157 / RJB 2259-6 / UBC 559-6) TaxID=578456 RepID=UPI00032CFA4A|nr:uncharacterized protein TREMEDRAFT_66224 [Tremella mesenterica DSM 1558]EIW65856.1 hypothetical protein TREMEDRAFT_66224 [Tremella mesenterica DSM 1558]